jgi:glycosyltransferase involved in cell wall biosynthesis
MHVLFANYHSFDNTSGIHIFHLANELERRGIRCTALVPDRPESAATFGSPRFRVQTFRQAWWQNAVTGNLRKKKDLLIHAWTPRESVRRPTVNLAGRLNIPYLVHLEDNERHIYLAKRAASRRTERRPRSVKTEINPWQWRKFLAGAAGLTCLVDSLLRFRPSHVPGLVFWPACEPEIFELPPTPNLPLRQSLGIPDDAIVLFYPGNVHAANFDDVSDLYRAVTLLSDRGLPVWLVRTGKTGGSFRAKLQLPLHLVDLGRRPAKDIPDLLTVADVLVQPGRADVFNDYRFPCKLPMFLASGRPVVLPASNIGKHLCDSVECLITRTGSAEEIAEKVACLVADPALRARIGVNGRAFANSHLRWDLAAERLIEFYQHILKGSAGESLGSEYLAMSNPQSFAAAMDAQPLRSDG